MPNEEIGDSGDFDDGREFVLQFESEKLDEEGDPYRWNHGPFSWSAVRDEYLTWLFLIARKSTNVKLTSSKSGLQTDMGRR